MITKYSIAYKDGFSEALNHGTYSAYMDIVKYEFLPANAQKLKKRFYAGYQAGLKIIREVREEMREFICERKWDIVVDEKYLLSQRSRYEWCTSGVGTVERENTI